MIKHSSVFFWWALFVGMWGAWRAAWRMGAAVALWCGSFAFYLPEGAERIIDRVLLYGSWYGSYGLQFILPKSLNFVVFVGGLLLLPIFLRARGWDVHKILLAQSMAFFALASGMGMNLFTTGIVLVTALSPAVGVGFALAALPTLHPAGMVWVYQTRMNGVWLFASGAWVWLMVGRKQVIPTRPSALGTPTPLHGEGRRAE